MDVDGAESVPAAIDTETVVVDCNVEDTDSVAAGVDETVDALGGIDVLVNIAGIVHRTDLAGAAAFLASADGDDVNGHVLGLDGGGCIANGP
jgi:NAD(P)-dependent dehydrogenase (short-subunit alcohol dehydrogenase family)